jgi:hypothetical protein
VALLNFVASALPLNSQGIDTFLEITIPIPNTPQKEVQLEFLLSTQAGWSLHCLLLPGKNSGKRVEVSLRTYEL